MEVPMLQRIKSVKSVTIGLSVLRKGEESSVGEKVGKKHFEPIQNSCPGLG